MHSFIRFAAALILIGTGASAADEARHINLARYYFASPADELKDRQVLTDMLTQLQQMRGHVTASPKALLQALQLNNRIQTTYARHDAYLHLRCRTNNQDLTACADENTLDGIVDSKTAFLTSEVASLSDSTRAAYLRREKRLAPYGYWLENARRSGAHTLTGPRGDAIGEFTTEISGWQAPLYDATMSSVDFGSVATSHGTLDVRRQRNLLAIDPDARVREEAFRKRYAAIASVRNTVAFALLYTAKAANYLAQARGIPNAPDGKYFDIGLDPKDVRGTIELVAGEGELNKRFERLRAREVEQALGLKTAGPWDMDVPLTQIPTLSLPATTMLMHDVFADIGPWYQNEFDALLDPANERFDVVPGGALHRSGGGFSVGYAGAKSGLFVGNFDGTYKDLSVIVHEGGHAVHRALMNAQGVLPVYTKGPHFVFESIAEFNELVLADYMTTHATDPATKRYYAERFLSIKGLDFLAGAQDAALEQAVYDGVAEGKITSADDLDALTLQVDSRFSVWPEREAELKARWEALDLAFEDPLYDVNYMYASMLALKYFQLYKEKPDWFLPRYRAFLANGFDDTPQHLLKRFLGIDLAGPGLVNDAVSVVNRRLKDLETGPS